MRLSHCYSLACLKSSLGDSIASAKLIVVTVKVQRSQAWRLSLEPILPRASSHPLVRPDQTEQPSPLSCLGRRVRMMLTDRRRKRHGNEATVGCYRSLAGHKANAVMAKRRVAYLCGLKPGKGSYRGHLLHLPVDTANSPKGHERLVQGSYTVPRSPAKRWRAQETRRRLQTMRGRVMDSCRPSALQESI